MKNRCWKIFGLGWLLVLGTINISMAATLKGKVTKVSAKTVTALLTQSSLARVGNEATIAIWIEGVGAIPIKGRWQVKNVSGSTIILVPSADDNAQPLVGQSVTIADTNHIIATASASQNHSNSRKPQTPTARPKPSVKPASISRSKIRYIQQRLGNLGYDAGAPDGAMGPKTRRAIRAYQRENGLSINGRASTALHRSLKAGEKRKITLLGKTAPDISQQKKRNSDNRPSNVIIQEAKNYYFGLNGKPQDYEKSLRLNRIVAGRGDPDALYSVGVAYAFGNGVAKDFSVAREFFEQSAYKGNSRAAFNLAAIYKKGLSVKKDNNKAMSYMRQAVENGDIETFHGIGNFYRLGIGVQASREKAISWYLKGARAGDKKCQEQLKQLGVKW